MADGFDSLTVLKSQLEERFHHLAVICPEDKFKLSGFEITTDLDYYLKQIKEYNTKIIYLIKPRDSFKINPVLDIPISVMTMSYGVIEFNRKSNLCRLLKSRYYLFDDGIQRDPIEDLLNKFNGNREAIYKDFIEHLVQSNPNRLYKIGSF